MATKQKPTKKIDWLKARMDYLQDSSLSYADIGKKYGVSLTTVKLRGVQEGWPELRQTLAEKAYKDFQTKLLDEKSNSQNRHLELYKNMQMLINKAQEVAAKDPKGTTAFDLDKLARALKTSIDGERVVLGLPTSVSGLTNGDGGDVWKGLSDLMAVAAKDEDEHDDQPSTT